DVRFVDVRTGVVAATVSVEDGRDDLMQLLVALSTAIARRFNEKLSQETLDQLAAKKMSKEEFERFARQELAKDSLRTSLQPTSAQPPSKAPFWWAVAGVVGGSALAATGFLVANTHTDAAAYNEALARVASQPSDQQKYQAAQQSESNSATAWKIVGVSGVAVAGGSPGGIIFPAAAGTETPPPPTFRPPPARRGRGCL